MLLLRLAAMLLGLTALLPSVDGVAGVLYHNLSPKAIRAVEEALVPTFQLADRLFVSQRVRQVCQLIEQHNLTSALVVGDEEDNDDVHFALVSAGVPTVLRRQRTANDVDVPLSLHLAPEDSKLFQLLADYMERMNWTRAVLMYSAEMALVEDFLLYASMHKWTIHLRRLPSNSSHMGPFVEGVQAIRESNLILYTSAKKMSVFFKESKELISKRYNWVILSWAGWSLTLREFRHREANVTLFGPGDFAAVVDTDKQINYEVRLLLDGVKALQHIEHRLHESDVVYFPSCNSPMNLVNATHILHLSDEIKEIGFAGFTGQVRFKADGSRWTDAASIFSIGNKGLKKVGDWHNDLGLSLNDSLRDNLTFVFGEEPLIVTTLPEAPYIMLKDNHEELEGNDKFEGFLVDLIHRLSLDMKFTYRMRIVSDGKYGQKDLKTGEWNGMIRELMDKRADLALAALTISAEREKVIDFTKPFITDGVGILMKKPTKLQDPGLLSFMRPLSYDVWASVCAACVTVTFILFVVNRYSPYQWRRPFGASEDDQEANLTFRNSIWFTLSALMQQGYIISVRSNSARIIASSWWMFVLILVSSYTANLAAFLTVKRLENPIKSAEDLVRQKEVHYGTVMDTQVLYSFYTSEVEIYKKMGVFMKTIEPSVLVKNTTEGVFRAKKGSYALLWDSLILDFIVGTNCDLMRVGSPLNEAGLGIAVPLDAPFREDLTIHILKLHEEGFIQNRKKYWWESLSVCKSDFQETSAGATELTLRNFAGSFLVLSVGVCLGLSVLLGECIWTRVALRRTHRTAQSISDGHLVSPRRDWLSSPGAAKDSFCLEERDERGTFV